MSKVNIAEKFAKINEYWKPYIGAELNGQYVKFDKLKGEFVFIITTTKTKCSWWSKAASAWISATATNGSKRASSSSFRAALNIVQSPTKNAGFCCSNRLLP